MSRFRVLHCIYDDPSNPWLGGGGAHRVFEIYRRLTDALDVTVAAGAFPAASDGPRAGVHYRYLGARWPYPLSRLTYGRAATALLRQEQYDAAYFDFSVYTPIAVPPSRPVGHVVHMPIGTTAPRRWGRLLGSLVAAREERMLSRARQIQTTSRWMMEWLRPRVAPGAEITVVRSGVDDSFFRVERAEGDYVLYYGRFDLYQKGLDLLLQSAPAVLADHPHVRLVLAGRGKDAREVAARAATLGPRVEIRRDPTRAEVQQLMAGALCLVHPSRFEGLPMVPAEAMAAGVPVVATDVGAVGELLETGDGRTVGRLVSPERREALAEAISDLLADPGLREELSTLARTAARRLSWDRVAADHLTHVRQLAGV